MGFSGVSVWSLLLILLIVVLVFGTKRLRSLGRDVGAGIKGFQEGMGEEKPAQALSEKKEEDDPS